MDGTKCLQGEGMNVFVIGSTGGIGRLLAQQLIAQGDSLSGLVRQKSQQVALEAQGIRAVMGDLARMTPASLATLFAGADVIVFTAGSNGGHPDVTKAIDGDGVKKAMEAATQAGIKRFILVSVLPESWRERVLGQEVEYYFSVKKETDVALSCSALDWLIVRPSLLTDQPGAGTVFLGPAALHEQISREDVALTLSTLVHAPDINRRILELNQGETPINEAVSAIEHCQ